jgi:stage V sporulation protein S
MDPINPTITRDGASDETASEIIEVITSTAKVYDDTEILKVSAHSRPSAVAGAIAAVIRNHGRADVQAIGAGATNQAIKAVAIARDYLQPNGIDIVVVPAFIDVIIADEERTAIRLVVESRS